MKLKKMNAALALVSIAMLMTHAGYKAVTYLLLIYNPEVSRIMNILPIVCIMLHAVFGMLTVFLQGDGTRASEYPRENARTILIRVSAALMLPLLLIHINMNSWLVATAGAKQWFLFGLVILAEVLFFAAVFTHAFAAMTRSFITLGWLASRQTQRRLDRVLWILGAVMFAAMSFIIIRAQISMYVH